ncbi:MAG TPA: DUF1499 domain-containing protein [Burkholderiaceae bacterium]|nr:DUF1499 domain-containing protein [Burkholderiaceae bacterium]
MSRRSSVGNAGLWLAVIGGVVLALAPIGYRMSWWPLRVSLLYLLIGAIVIGVLAVIVSLVGAFLARRVSGTPGVGGALVGVLLGLVVAGYPGAHVVKARGEPPIHDITTDATNPPVFVALAQERHAAPNGLDYAGGEVTMMQKQAYPDVTTFKSTLAPAELFARAAKLVADDGWQVVDAVPQDGRIEATATTRMFGFKDDIVLRVRQADGGSELDMRSMSRIGKSDIGTNAARIRRFMEQLRAAGA